MSTESEFGNAINRLKARVIDGITHQRDLAPLMPVDPFDSGAVVCADLQECCLRLVCFPFPAGGLVGLAGELGALLVALFVG